MVIMTSLGSDCSDCVNTTIVRNKRIVAFFVSAAEWALEIFLLFLKHYELDISLPEKSRAENIVLVFIFSDCK